MMPLPAPRPRSFRGRHFALAALLALGLPLSGHAHRVWLLPSATVHAGQDPWLTVDAAVSNELFSFEHVALRLDGLSITAPDGRPQTVTHTAQGALRNTFDLKLTQPGTYRIAVLSDQLIASFKSQGEPRRLRGTAESLAREIPADAQQLNVTRSLSRVETFVTAGRPTTQALQPVATGLDLQTRPHPNDLQAGSPATLRFTLDGRPAAGLNVTVALGGKRYRDQPVEMQLTTDAQGEVQLTWPQAGMYWVQALPPRDEKNAPVGTLAAPVRRASYAATLEVLPP